MTLDTSFVTTKENHVCIWCGKPTTTLNNDKIYGDLSYKKCDICNVSYRFKNNSKEGTSIFDGYSIRREYNGKRYAYRFNMSSILSGQKKVILSRLNREAKDPFQYYEDVCKVDFDKITPENALSKIPMLLVFSWIVYFVNNIWCNPQ